MGLDSFWVSAEDDQSEQTEPLKIEFDPPLQLCGGLFSENGNGSFRGKVYSDFVEELTGQGLYRDWIYNPAIREMAVRLQEAGGREDIYYLAAKHGVTFDEYRDLTRMFAAYAEAGACLQGWW